MAKSSEIFGRINQFGLVDILYANTGEPAECIEDPPVFVFIENVYEKPLSVKYMAAAVSVTMTDAQVLNIEIEPYCG